jgi:hypothetical protein
MSATTAALVRPDDWVFVVKMPLRSFNGCVKFGLRGTRTCAGFEILEPVRDDFLVTWKPVHFLSLYGDSIGWCECHPNIKIQVCDCIIGVNEARLDVCQQDARLRCQPLTDEMTAAPELYILITRPTLHVPD